MKSETKTRVFGLLGSFIVLIAVSTSAMAENKEHRLEWLKDAGLGLFIHWGVDSQIGTVISHSLVGSSAGYQKRYFEDLSRTFNPTRFDPREWARLARIAGFQYVVFTAKHHSGFSMFDTKTNGFNIMNTPYGRDITRDLLDAFRQEGIAAGLYFSPDDFYVLHSQGHEISRVQHEAAPINNAELMAINKKQVTELLTGYGDIATMFIDGHPVANEGDWSGGLRDLVWDLQPDVVITRGAMPTPEISSSTGQKLPLDLLGEPWEACFTMGTSWQFKPTNEKYRSGTEWIQTLIETRAKGGTMLLNIGPEPNGEIPKEQENILREIGAWMMINQEAIYGVRPWTVIREGNIWFTKEKDVDTVYAIVTQPDWKWGTEKMFSIKSVVVGENSTISVLGQSGNILEYQPDVIPQTRWEQRKDELVITATRTQRVYNDRTWPNPVVLKITDAKAR